MGLNLEISLDRDIREINAFFNDLMFNAVTKSARQGLNRAAERTRSFAIRELRKRRKLKLSDLKGSKKKGKKGFVTVRKATGNNLATLEARVNFSGVSLPLILFITGQASPKTQTLPNPRRRSRKFEIVQGQKKEKKGLFVQKAQRGSMRFQVFRRTDKNDKSQGFKTQTAPSIASLLRSKSNLLRKIENNAIALMQTEYSRALANNLRNVRL